MQCNKMVLMCFVSALLCFSGCGKENKSAVQVNSKKDEVEVKPDLELEKLGRVLSKMSPRFLEVVTISDIQAFLADLNVVLQEEKTFRNDDLSLYYLIDKKHNVGSDYVPKDLVPLKKNDLFAISRNDLSLRPEAYKALEALSQGALNDGIKLLVSSTPSCDT